MASASRSQARSVNSVMDSHAKSFQVVLLHKPYGVVLSLVQINLSSSLHILDGKVVDLADGLFIQPFAEFSLN